MPYKNSNVIEQEYEEIFWMYADVSSEVLKISYLIDSSTTDSLTQKVESWLIFLKEGKFSQARKNFQDVLDSCSHYNTDNNSNELSCSAVITYTKEDMDEILNLSGRCDKESIRQFRSQEINKNMYDLLQDKIHDIYQQIDVREFRDIMYMLEDIKQLLTMESDKERKEREKYQKNQKKRFK